MILLRYLDLNGNEVRNATIQNLATPPSSPAAGRVYYDTALGYARIYNGTTWATLDPLKYTLDTLTPPAASLNLNSQKIINLATPTLSTDASTKGYIDTKTLDTFAAPTASLSLNSQKITNLATPTLSTDATTKAYVDSLGQSTAAGISGKGSVVAVSTTNITTLSGTAVVVDGVTLSIVGERVLLTGQTTASQNGPYVVQSGAWTRPTTDSNNELETGALWFVEQGTTYKATSWWLSTPAVGTTITPGTTSITIVQFGAAASYTASLGVKLVGSDFEANYGAGLTLSSNTLIVDTSVVARKYSTAVGDGTSTSITVTHNLGTVDIVWIIRDSSGNQVITDGQAATTNTLILTFSTAPAASAYRVTVIG